MNISIDRLSKVRLLNALGWGWIHWLVLALVLLVAVTEVYDRQTQRLHNLEASKLDVIEEDIQQYNTMAERLATLEVLPPVKDQWDYAVAIGKKYGVELAYQAGTTKYRGPLEAWGGKVSGSTGAVLVVAKELQETVPTYLFNFSLTGNTATFDFAVLGSE